MNDDFLPMMGFALAGLPSIDDMDYASNYEKAYGVNDERLSSLAWHQGNLRRFEKLPTYDASLDDELERLRIQRDELASHGYDPRADTGSAAGAFRIEFAHNTTALEGNALTLAETSMVLERNLTIPEKSLRDHLEVVDADDAYALIRKRALETEPLSKALVLETHAIIAAHLEEANPGSYRTDMRYITSSRIYPPPPTHVDKLMNMLLSASIAQPGLENAAMFHLVFEDIHPFGDGNGRTGRALLNLQLLEAGYVPIAFKADHDSARRYYSAIASFTEDIEKRDATAMLRLVIELESIELGKRMTEIE